VTALMSKSELLAALKSQASILGLRVRERGDTLAGEMETIKAKWPLGSRRLAYQMSLRLVETEHTVHFREMTVEKSRGLPPPTLTAEWESISGWKRSGERTDRSIGGGGAIDYARVREALEQQVTAAGWRLHFEGGRAP
jgi:hypothetical protein